MDRDVFGKAAERFKLIVEKYQDALQKALSKSKAAFEKRIIDEFSKRWEQSPPKYFARWDIKPTAEKIAAELQRLAQEIFEEAVTFDKPVVRIVPKNVAPENIRDSAFLDALKSVMLKKRVPRNIIDSLFEAGQAAPETGAFLK